MSGVGWPRRTEVPVTMKEHDFLTMMRHLSIQSENCREAGAFLMGPAAGNSVRRSKTKDVVAVLYYCDLDPNSLTGGITFHASGYTRLNKICRERGMRVVADIHLHPGSSTRQSRTDAAHPMVARGGHLALIAPDFGSRVYRASQLGAHVKTNSGWLAFEGRKVNRAFQLRWTLRGRLERICNRLARRTNDVDRPDDH